jgi:hypothetical protein
MFDSWFYPDPEDYPEKINSYDLKLGGMNPEKDDNNNTVSPEEMEKIEKFLESINPLINPPND